jgi:pectate lyase
MSAALAAIALAMAGAVTERQHAPVDGWAAQDGGTRGGALAAPEHVYTVRSAAQLRDALRAPAPARIVRVAASIDMNESQPFTDRQDQARRSVIRIPANTTLLGVTLGAGLVNASLAVSGVAQVIVRNLALRNPCDIDPRWDPKDGAKGNWNSQYDAISVANAHHVWIDHNSFTDAPVTDDTQPIENGMPKQCHDGALDITSASSFVSVTYNHFALHEKNTLVGGADRATGDRTHLRVTFKGNLFEHVSERAPRVRYGQVHLLNNYHVGDRKHPAYAHGYSVGVAHEAHVISHANAYDVTGASKCAHIVRDPGGSPGTYLDTGSTLNGQPLTGCGFAGDVGWRVPYPFTPLPAGEVPRHVLDHAGPRLVDDADGFVEARLMVKEGDAPFILKARQDDRGHWQGASIRAVDGGAALQIALLEARGGLPLPLKNVRRRAPLAGVPVVLRFASQAGELSVWLDGERVTSARTARVAAERPVAWEAAQHMLLDMRDGPAAMPAAGVNMGLATPALALQAGDPVERIAVSGAFTSASSSDPAVASVSLRDGAVHVTPLAPGRAVVMLAGTAWEHAAFAVDVGKSFAAPPRTLLTRARLQPQHAERGVPPDTPLVMTWDRSPVLSGAGSVRVVRRRDGAIAAVIRPGEAVIALGPPGRQRIVRHRAMQIDDKTLRVRLPALLDDDTEYEVLVDAALLRDRHFKGARWTFRTTPYRPVGDSITVDDDGRSDFRTVQGALDHAMTLPRAKPVTINVRDGVYPELLYLRDKDNVMLRGQSREATIIRAANSDALNPGSGTGQDVDDAAIRGGRALFLAQDSDLLEIRDIALHNTTRRSSGPSAQAEALFFNNDRGRLIVRNAHFTSEQDTLQLTGYAWIYRSLIEGNVDFIWGNNRAALFEESEIRSIGDSASPANGGYLVQARTITRDDPGFVFLRSRLTHGVGPAGNRPPKGTVYLARSPGTAYTWDNVAFVGGSIGTHIARDAWLREPMPNPARGDARVGWRESGNTGVDGEITELGGYQMDEHEARLYGNRAAVFSRFDDGKGWRPQP